MKVLIVKDDAIPEALEGLLKAGDNAESFEILPISRFITLHGYRYDSASGRFISDAAVARTLEANLLVDRVVEVTQQSCLALAGGGAPTLFRGQVLHVYQMLLRRYLRLGESQGCYATVGTLVPLFTQWGMVNKTLPWLKVPDYKYGYGPEVIDASEFERPVYKTPFDLYDWRPNAAPEGIPDDSFVVNRPEGTPMLLFFCGRQVAARCLSDGSLVDKQLVSRMRDTVLLIADKFSAFMGETLWFMHGDTMTFAAFSHRLDAAKRFPETRDLFLDAVEVSEVVSS